jgi:hypothetical protein
LISTSTLGRFLAIEAMCSRSSALSEWLGRFFTVSMNWLSPVRGVSAGVAVRLRVAGRNAAGLGAGVKALRICCSKSTGCAGAFALPAISAAARRDPAVPRASIFRIVAMAVLPRSFTDSSGQCRRPDRPHPCRRKKCGPMQTCRGRVAPDQPLTAPTPHCRSR